MVIIFSNEKARNQLLNEGFVYTIRKNRRKQFIKMPEDKQRMGYGVIDWATDRRGGKKICDVIIYEYDPVFRAPGPYDINTLQDYVSHSGFGSLEEWIEAIHVYSPGLAKGWMYSVCKYRRRT